VLSQNINEIEIPIQNYGDWIKLNWGHTGFYRINYPKEMWMEYIQAIENGEIPSSDMIGLLYDAHALFSHQMVDFEVVLKLSHACSKHATNDYLMHAIFYDLDKWYTLLLDDDELAPIIKPIFQQIIERMLGHINWLKAPRVNGTNVKMDYINLLTFALKTDSDILLQEIKTKYPTLPQLDDDELIESLNHDHHGILIISTLVFKSNPEEYNKCYELAINLRNIRYEIGILYARNDDQLLKTLEYITNNIDSYSANKCIELRNAMTINKKLRKLIWNTLLSSKNEQLNNILLQGLIGTLEQMYVKNEIEMNVLQELASTNGVSTHRLIDLSDQYILLKSSLI